MVWVCHSQKVGSYQKLISTSPKSSQVVNGSHVSKCCNYYHFIMKAYVMKNSSIRIMYSLQPLTLVPYTQGCAMGNLKFDLKHLVAMNLVLLGMIPPST
jgi:hypothetical protein